MVVLPRTPAGTGTGTAGWNRNSKDDENVRRLFSSWLVSFSCFLFQGNKLDVSRNQIHRCRTACGKSTLDNADVLRRLVLMVLLFLLFLVVAVVVAVG